MKRFEFRLQKLLELARRREDFARRELAVALSGVRRAEALEAEARDAVRTAAREITELVGEGGLDPVDLEMRQTCLRSTERRVERRVAERELAEMAYEQKRVSMLAERRQMLALERAREHAHEDWRYGADRKELEEMDEIALNRAKRSDET